MKHKEARSRRGYYIGTGSQWRALHELTLTPLENVRTTRAHRSNIRYRGRSRAMSRVAHLKGFDTVAGVETKHTMQEVDALVKRAGMVSKIGSDVLLKDKAGRIFHELYDYNKYILWVAEHPAAA